MNNFQPKVSVIIPTYKRPDTLTRAIDSVLKQSYNNVEAIVVDDNNPDTEGRQLTEAVMEAYKDNPRVKYIKHPHNKNGSAARNTGANSTDAEYVAFLDDDDEFLPNKIESQVERLESLGDDWGVCYSKYYNQNDNEKPVEGLERMEGDLYFPALCREISLVAGSNLLVRKKCFEKVGGFDETFLRNQDHEFLTKVAKQYKIAYCDVPGLIVHGHAQGTTPKKDYEAIANKYIETFQKDIDALSIKEKKLFYRRINKQVFFFRIREHKDIKGAFKMIIKREVKLIDAISIFWKRMINYIYRLCKR